MSATQKVLLVRLSAHGDVLQTLPVLAALKAQNPRLFVGWLVEASAAPLLRDHPLIDCLHIVDRKHWLKTRNFKAFWRMLMQLRRVGYTHALDVQGLLKSALWPWLAGIRYRLGFSRSREYSWLFYSHRLPAYPKTQCHPPLWRKQLDFLTHPIVKTQLLAAAPILETSPIAFPLWPISRAGQQHAAQLWQQIPAAQQAHTLVLAPGTRWASKQWPIAYWQQLIDHWAPHPVVLLGGPDEQILARAIVAEQAHWQHVYNWVGQTDWDTLAAVLQRTRVLVAADSAPLHLASALAANAKALNQPVLPHIIGLYGSTSPYRTGPYSTGSASDKHSVLTAGVACQPCFKRVCPLDEPQHMACQNQLLPQHVLRAIVGVDRNVVVAEVATP